MDCCPRAAPAQGDPRQHATWLASRPRRFERNAVRALLGALRATAGNATLPGFRVHVVHLSGAHRGRHSSAVVWGRWVRLSWPTATDVGRRPHPRASSRPSLDSPHPVHPLGPPDADLLPELAAAKAEGLPLSVETCPHYLNFAAEDVPSGDTR